MTNVLREGHNAYNIDNGLLTDSASQVCYNTHGSIRCVITLTGVSGVL